MCDTAGKGQRARGKGGTATARHCVDRLPIAVLVCVCAALLPATCGAQGNPFRNVVNEPFATVCNGPQGAIVVNDGQWAMGNGQWGNDINDVTTAAAVKALATKAAIETQHAASDLRRATRPLRVLQARGLTLTGKSRYAGGVNSPHARVAFPRRVVHLREGKIVAPDLMRTLASGSKLGEPTNELTFTFEGFEAADQAAFEAYLAQALPKAYSIYGRPAFNLSVKIILDPDLHVLQGGIYDSAANEIRMSPLSGNFPEDSYILMILVLYAFHDDAAFFYDPWEEGFAGAAATAVQTSPGIAPGYNPIDPGPFYATSVYEPQNQPDLGGPTYYPASGFRGMLVWRVAMARSAWFKPYVEDNDFFKRFNQAYYAAHNAELPGSVPALRVLGSQVLPSVEGMPFQEWFQRQHVLDTSVRLGPKLFIWNIPLTQAVALIVEHFFVGLGGDEEPLGGQVRTTYWSYDFAVSLYAEEGNTIDIPASGEGAAQGQRRVGLLRALSRGRRSGADDARLVGARVGPAPHLIPAATADPGPGRAAGHQPGADAGGAMEPVPSRPRQV